MNNGEHTLHLSERVRRELFGEGQLDISPAWTYYARATTCTCEDCRARGACVARVAARLEHEAAMRRLKLK